MGLVPLRFAIFPLHLSKVLRLPRKVMTSHTKCCTCHAKSSSQTWRSDVQKWSEPLVSLTFWLGNVLRATTACTFSTSQLPKVVRTWCILYRPFRVVLQPESTAKWTQSWCEASGSGNGVGWSPKQKKKLEITGRSLQKRMAMSKEENTVRELIKKSMKNPREF